MYYMYECSAPLAVQTRQSRCCCKRISCCNIGIKFSTDSPSVHLYQKDERELPGNLQKSQMIQSLRTVYCISSISALQTRTRVWGSIVSHRWLFKPTFRVITPCSLARGCSCFIGTYRLHLQGKSEGWGSIFIRMLVPTYQTTRCHYQIIRLLWNCFCGPMLRYRDWFVVNPGKLQSALQHLQIARVFTVPGRSGGRTYSQNFSNLLHSLLLRFALFWDTTRLRVVILTTFQLVVVITVF